MDFIDWVNDYEYSKLEIAKPDVVIFLKANFDVVMDLKSKRESNDGVSNDIHERDNSFMKKVYDNALFVADYLKWNEITCDKDGQMKTIAEIHKDIINVINKL